MARTRTHECRNCGAPLGIPSEHARYFTCGSCGSVLEDVTPPEAKAAGRIEITVADGPTIDVSTLQSYSRPARTVGAVVVAVVLLGLATAGISTAVLIGSFETAAPAGTVTTADGISLQIYNYAAAAALATDADDGATPDVIAVARTDAESQLVLIDLDDPVPLRWSVGRESEADVFTQFLAAGALVLVSTGDQIAGHDGASGTQRWSAELSDVVEPNICTDCVRLFGDSVVTLTADGVLAAHSVATGEPQWSTTLTETPRQILDFGGSPAVLDTVGGEPQLHVFSPSDGTVAERLPLSCPDTTFGGRSPVNIYDTLFAKSDGTIVYIADPVFGGCVQVWAPGAGGMPQSEVAYEYPDPSGPDVDHVVVSRNRALVAAGTAVDLLDLGGDTPRRLLDRPDTRMYPIGLTETVAVVAVESTRGTSSWSIVALDVATGAEKWSFAIDAEESLIDSRSFSVDSVWTAALTSAGVAVAQYRDDDVELVVQIISVETGTASSPVVTDLSGRGPSDSLSVHGWFGDALLVAMDGTMVMIDGTTGSRLAEGP